MHDFSQLCCVYELILCNAASSATPKQQKNKNKKKMQVNI